MNRLACLAVGLVAFGTTFGSFEGVAVAQPTNPPTGTPAAGTSAAPAAPPSIPGAVKTADKPEANRAEITRFISGHLARVLSGDAKAAKDSRDALVSEVLPPVPSVSSAFKDVYAEELAKAVAPHLKEKNPQARLQVAVLVGRVALAVDNDRLKGAAEQLVADPNVGIAIWGMKAARGIIAQQVQTPAALEKSSTLAAVVNVAMKNPAEGNLVREAYEALQISQATAVGKLKGAIPVLAPKVLDLLVARSALYAKGIPEQADADREPGTFFGLHAFTGLTQEQKVKVVQALSDQLLLTAQYAVTTPSGPQQKAITDLTQSAGNSLNLIAVAIDQGGSTAQTKALVAATDFFKWGRIPPPAATILTNAQATVTAVKAIPAYSSITVAQAAPAPAAAAPAAPAIPKP